MLAALQLLRHIVFPIPHNPSIYSYSLSAWLLWNVVRVQREYMTRAERRTEPRNTIGETALLKKLHEHLAREYVTKSSLGMVVGQLQRDLATDMQEELGLAVEQTEQQIRKCVQEEVTLAVDEHIQKIGKTVREEIEMAVENSRENIEKKMKGEIELVVAQQTGIIHKNINEVKGKVGQVEKDVSELASRLTLSTKTFTMHEKELQSMRIRVAATTERQDRMERVQEQVEQRSQEEMRAVHVKLDTLGQEQQKLREETIHERSHIMDFLIAKFGPAEVQSGH